MLYFGNYFNAEPKKPAFTISPAMIRVYLEQEEKITDLISNYFLCWTLHEATIFYQEMKPSHMIIRIKDGPQFLIKEPHDLAKLSLYSLKTKIDKITFDGLNDKLGIKSAKYPMRNIRIKRITTSKLMHYKTTRHRESVFDLDYRRGYTSKPAYDPNVPDRITESKHTKIYTYLEISFESDKLNLDENEKGVYRKYSFKELKEYLAYTYLERIVRKTQQKAETFLTAEEIRELIKTNYMYEESLCSYKTYVYGDDFCHYSESVETVRTNDTKFSPYLESRDFRNYRIDYLLDRERAVIKYEPLWGNPKYNLNITRIVLLSDIRADRIYYESLESIKA